jgi:hypothetical protein
MQTDDTFILIDQSFAIAEKEAIHSAKIMIKTREQLILNNSSKFNDTRIERIDSNDIIYYRQETHIQDIQLIQLIESIITSARDKVRIKLISRKQYVTQRAREAYLTSICQLEASFDLFHAAQLSRDKTTNIFERVKIEANHHISLRMRSHHVISRLALHLAYLQFVRLNK